MKYVCTVCGYVYDETAGDPDHNIAPGTKWEELPDDFVCALSAVWARISSQLSKEKENCAYEQLGIQQ